MAFRGNVQLVNQENYASMNTTLRIYIDGPGWQQRVSSVLNGIHGVSVMTMEDDGTVVISGSVDPSLLRNSLRQAGLTASILHCQYEASSTNRFVYSNGGGGGDNNYHSQAHSSHYPQYRGSAIGYPRNGNYMYPTPRYGWNSYAYPRYGGNGHLYGGHGGSISPYDHPYMY